MDTGDAAFATNLRQFRTARGLSQERLAEMVGTATTQVCRWETAAQDIKLGNMRRVASALGVSLDALVGDEDGQSLAGA